MESLDLICRWGEPCIKHVNQQGFVLHCLVSNTDCTILKGSDAVVDIQDKNTQVAFILITTYESFHCEYKMDACTFFAS